MNQPTTPPPDTLNEIGVLKRREIEARIIGPLLDAFTHEFGSERVLEIARNVVIRIAREQGERLAAAMNGDTLAYLAASLAAWRKDDALQTEVLEQTDERFSFNVTRCRYAELYRALGMWVAAVADSLNPADIAKVAGVRTTWPADAVLRLIFKHVAPPVMIEGAGHSIQEDADEEVAQRIAE